MLPWRYALAVILFAFAVSGFAQFKSTVPYEPSPSFHSDEMNYAYPGKFSSLRNIDFRNFNIRQYEKNVRLTAGKYEKRDRLGYESLEFDEVHYLLSDPSSNAEYVLLLLFHDAASGSSNQEAIAQVLELSNGRLRLVQEIEVDVHFGRPQPTHSFAEATGVLVMNSTHYRPGDAHCCISAMDALTFKWNGRRFVQTAIETKVYSR
jgi:hypothetical protein